MDKILQNIDKQIAANQGKNIFSDNLDDFQFIHETIDLISKTGSLPASAEKILIDYTTEKAIEEFCRINQYYSFDSQSKEDLKKIYTCLLADVIGQRESVEDISKRHYNNLKDWLRKTNSFAEKIYRKMPNRVEAVPCSEYSPELQLEILRLDIHSLIEPVLDIGCGQHGNLVEYIQSCGKEVYGIDRFSFITANLITADWLEYNYGIKKWGTVISHLGFTNHFVHHNLREDGNYIEYARVYMNILRSLKPGGSFYYTPDLPFIEKYLDKNQFILTKYDLAQREFKSSKITSLK